MYIRGFCNGEIIKHHTKCFDFDYHLALHPSNLSIRRQSGITIQFASIQLSLETISR
jgi:hypothetical protein